MTTGITNNSLTNEQKARLERQISLIGEKKTMKLISSSVLVFGVGGVGGYACEALVRTGIGNIIIVDCDTIALSNLNRQIISNIDNIGESKVEVMRKRILSINPDCNVKTLPVFVNSSNAHGIVSESNAGYIIDAIDNVSAKIAIIASSKVLEKMVISCMGTGNKFKINALKIVDIAKTSVCPLARAVRKGLKDIGVTGVDVLFSDEPVVSNGARTPSSISYLPAAAGLMLAEYVIGKIIA